MAVGGSVCSVLKCVAVRMLSCKRLKVYMCVHMSACVQLCACVCVRAHARMLAHACTRAHTCVEVCVCVVCMIGDASQCEREKRECAGVCLFVYHFLYLTVCVWMCIGSTMTHILNSLYRDTYTKLILSICWTLMIQDGEDAVDALRCRSLSAKEPLIVRLFCGKWPIKIRHPVRLRHPLYVYQPPSHCTMTHILNSLYLDTYTNIIRSIYVTHSHPLPHTYAALSRPIRVSTPFSVYRDTHARRTLTLCQLFESYVCHSSHTLLHFTIHVTHSHHVYDPFSSYTWRRMLNEYMTHIYYIRDSFSL